MPPVFVFSHFWLLFYQTDKKRKKKKDNNSKVLYGFLRGETIKVEHIVWWREGGGAGGRLKMCEEALSNQVKEKEKKKSFVRNRRK